MNDLVAISTLLIQIRCFCGELGTQAPETVDGLAIRSLKWLLELIRLLDLTMPPKREHAEVFIKDEDIEEIPVDTHPPKRARHKA